jgi:hypothetical protein
MKKDHTHLQLVKKNLIAKTDDEKKVRKKSIRERLAWRGISTKDLLLSGIALSSICLVLILLLWGMTLQYISM